ncbi:hypothetical protein F5X99DRAFT_382411 [Biscogniauxia marginata]|nr:hypothetical protein F5X99DRAFT_382411 [Biscogniauxia marginata]
MMASAFESPLSPAQSALGKPETTTPPTSLPKEPTHIYIDPDGDLHLEVGTKEAARLFVVCSRTMARSSAFWKTLLYGQFAESKKPQPGDDKTEWVVKLPEDNPESMKMLLDIVHGRFEFVPGYEDSISVPNLYDLCVLTDKYDMTHVMRPWARGWSKSVQPISKWSIMCHEKLWTSWELGDKASFKEVAKHLLLNYSGVSVKHYPRFLFGFGLSRKTRILEAPGIYENIERIRLDTIDKLIAPFHDTLQKLIRNDNSLCIGPKGYGNCTHSMLGTTIQSLQSGGLWPIPNPKDVKISLWEFSETLRRVEVETGSGQTHRCTLTQKLQAGIDETMKLIPSLLTAEHRRHLKTQAKKSGLISKPSA